MGFLRKVRRSVKSPLFRGKRRRQEKKLLRSTTTCDVSEVTGSIREMESLLDSSDEEEPLETLTEIKTVVPPLIKRFTVSSDEPRYQEMCEDDCDEPDCIQTSDRNEKNRQNPIHENKDLPTVYLETLFGDENPLSPSSHSSHHRDGLVHVYHDDLATLYEESLKSEGDEESSEVSRSEECQLMHRAPMDEFGIRARWDYAMDVMAGMSQCDASLDDICDSFAEVVPMTRALAKDSKCMGEAEI